jgi:membrane protease YdiL (CAAX protease family)
MRNYLYRHSLVLFVVVIFVRGLLGGLTVKGVQMLDPSLTVQKDLGWLVMVVYTLVVYLAVKWVRIDKEIGLAAPSTSRDWYVWIPLLIMPVFLALNIGFHSAWGHVPFLMIAAIGVAVNEEILFRGILLRAILPFGKAFAIIIPSLLFGASHLGNILVGGDVTYSLFQFGWTFLSGMAITAMRLQSKSLLPAIVFHIILDGTEYAATGEFGVHSLDFSIPLLVMFTFLNLALLVYALLTMKRSSGTITMHHAGISSAKTL